MFARSERKNFLSFQFLSFILLMTLFSVCHAQEFPTRAIDIVVPYAPGGGVDTFFRQVRETLAKELNVPVSIVNRTGGGGVVGSSFVANSKADGYTLLGQELMSFMMPEIITPKAVPFLVLRDFRPVAHFAFEPLLLVVRPDLEFKTLEGLIASAKKNPGKLLAGTSGIGTQNRIDLELLKIATGANIRFVSFSGGGEVLVNLLGGHVDLTFSTLTVSRPHVKAGKLRALAVLSTERLPEFSEVPTTREKGVPEVKINMSYALLGPKGLPSEITEKLSHTVNSLLKSSETLANLNRQGYVVDFSTPNQLEERMKRDYNLYTDVAKKAGLIQD
ncbi:MAG: Bug family tripartite tricarboxylate transporter substrate binding protein [Thermodesulfobacteriota bacterium]